MKAPFIAAGLISGLISVTATQANSSTLNTQETNTQHSRRAVLLDEFYDFLSLPNHAKNQSDIRKNADWLSAYLEKRNFAAEIWTEGGAPYVFAERKVKGAKKTILIYAHFDGQPVAPENWSSAPFEPKLRSDSIKNAGIDLDWDELNQGPIDPNWRIFARSSSDDKAAIIAIGAALDELDASGISSSVNIKLILDGEEEGGSPSLQKILTTHAEQLSADLMIFADGPMHQSGHHQLIFGVRGAMGVDLTTYGPNRPLHSGHYGNFAPSPNDELVRILNSLKDRDGNIVVPGYDRQVIAPTEAEKEAIAKIPYIDTSLKRELDLGRTEGNGDRIELLMMRPAIIIRGIQGGDIGDQARNIIQPTATGSLNIRLANGQTVGYVRRALEAYFSSLGFRITYKDPDGDMLANTPRLLKVDWKEGAYPAYRSDIASPAATALSSILEQATGKEPVMTPTLGGSLPIHHFSNALDMPIILLPIANHDNNQHGRDENIRIGNLFDAVKIYKQIFTELGNKNLKD